MLGRSNQIIGDPKEDFFEQNPKLMYYNEVIQLVREVGKEKASKIMWAAHLIEDPNSPYRTMEYSDRVININENYLEDAKFNWEKYNYIILAYPNIALTKKQSRYKILDDALDSTLARLISPTTSDKDMTTIMSKIKAMYESLRVAEKEAEEEQVKIDRARGEQQPGMYNT